MEQNRILCTSVKYSDLKAGTMTLSKTWGYSSPSLLQSEIVLSLENGLSAAVKVKTGSSGNRMLYGERFRHFLLRHNIRHDFRMEFQNVGGNKFYVRIRDTQGVEIDYEIREVDNSRSYMSKKKGTPPSLCKMFGEEEFEQGYLAVPGIWGNHFPVLFRGVVYLLVSDGRRWAIETEKLNEGTIRFFGVEFRKLLKHYGVRTEFTSIFDYGETSSFNLMLTDKNGIKIEYERDDEGDVKGLQKSHVSIAGNSQDRRRPYGEEFVMDDDSDDSDSSSDEGYSGEVLVMEGDSDDSDSIFHGVETVEDEMGNVEANSYERDGIQYIWYRRGYLIGGNYGATGSPGFLKKMTNPICNRFQPMYIPRRFVTTHLLPLGKPNVGTMLVETRVQVQCNIRWGCVSNMDDAYITTGMTSLMNALKPDVGKTFMFRLVDSDADANSVTFEVKKMNF
ncbi:hypothetical protein ACFE04_028836 [Oxalis oulophora]